MNKKYVDDFNYYINKNKTLSNNTKISYMLDLKKILDYIKEESLVNFCISEKRVENFLLELKKEGYSKSTILRIISSINIFNKFLYENNFLKMRVKLEPKINFNNKSEKEFIIFSREEIYKILDIKDLNFNSIRDKAILELTYAIGIKPTDCINLLLENINLDIGYIKYKNIKGQFKTIPLNNESLQSLKNYLIVLSENNIVSEYLFVSKNGERLTRQGYWKIFKKRQQELNLKKELNPTNFRNSLVIHLLEDNVADEIVMDILSLNNISSYKKYVLRKNNSLKNMLINHPRNKIKE